MPSILKMSTGRKPIVKTLISLFIVMQSYAPSVTEAVPSSNHIETIELNQYNTVMFRGPVTRQSMYDLLIRTIVVAETTNEFIYLAIATPGGDLNALEWYLTRVAPIAHRIKTISVESQSAGFHLIQRLPGERLILPNGMVMSHPTRVGGVTYPGNMISDLISLIETNKVIARRVGLSLEQYNGLILHDLYSYGYSAKLGGFVDRVVNVVCSFELTNTVMAVPAHRRRSPEYEYWSSCPLLTDPL
jgi:ATP-dependent protease ClpP protease subunit